MFCGSCDGMPCNCVRQSCTAFSVVVDIRTQKKNQIVEVSQLDNNTCVYYAVSFIPSLVPYSYSNVKLLFELLEPACWSRRSANALIVECALCWHWYRWMKVPVWARLPLRHLLRCDEYCRYPTRFAYTRDTIGGLATSVRCTGNERCDCTVALCAR